MNKNIIIGIAGGSGSGKTFFAQALHKKLGKECSLLIYQDNFYKDQSSKFDFDGGSVNFDHPESIDFNLLAKQLCLLKDNKSVEIPMYEFSTHTRKEETVKTEPKKVIIVDGILLLSQSNMREIFDISVFVETPEEIRFQRRLQRDITERGRTREGVINQFEKQVKPMHDKFVEPSKIHADHVNSGTDMNAFYALLDKLKDKCIK